MASIRSHNTDTHRVCVTVCRVKLDFPGITTPNCASLTTTKCLINTLSTTYAIFLTLDIKIFYYNTPMDRYEYMKMDLAIIPEEIIAQYQLRSLTSDGWIYMEICKGMPDLNQAGRIAHNCV